MELSPIFVFFQSMGIGVPGPQMGVLRPRESCREQGNVTIQSLQIMGWTAKEKIRTHLENVRVNDYINILMIGVNGK